MAKAILKRAPQSLIILTALLFGCADPAKNKADTLTEVAQLTASGNFEKAEQLLNRIAETYPNDLEGLIARADLYQAQQDPDATAFILEQATLQAPDDMDLLFRTYQALQAAGQPADAYLEKLAINSAPQLTSKEWERLGAIRTQSGQIQEALDAYLRAVDFENHVPTPETATSIGQLYLRLDNFPQAERWFNTAAESDDPNALSALFGLLEIFHHNKDWSNIELILNQLETQFPGAVEASQWAKQPEEIKQWRQVQKDQTREIAEISDSVNQAITEEEPDLSETSIREATVSTESEEIKESDTATAKGKSALIDELEAVMEMADRPAIEPDLPPPPPNPDQLMDEARLAEEQRDYDTAIKNYWQALGTANQRADIWNLLSRAYLVDGQIENAETASLEALRLDPENVSYTLDYLRIIQRTKQADELFTELQIAYDRFPESPEIVLSLARAYERIGQDTITASNAYRRFIELAPAHHLRPEAEAALNRLR